MKPLLNEHVAGRIVTEDGTILDRPATVLDTETAKILRDYFYWALTHQLEPELFCATCYDGTRESRAQYQINEQQIVIVCRCRQLFHQGIWAKPTACAPSVSVPDDTAGPLNVLLSDDAARLLRLYKKVLTMLGLKEALRCNACYNLDLRDGLEAAQVLDNSITLKCQCSNRTYLGMTI